MTAATVPFSSSFSSTHRFARLARRGESIGRWLSGLAIAFLGFDASVKVLGLVPAEQATQDLGFPGELIGTLGVIQLIGLALYVWPRSRIVGAIMWTGYLGGAIAIHVRVGSPLFSHTLFPIYIALLLWGGIWLRNPQFRALLTGTRLA